LNARDLILFASAQGLTLTERDGNLFARPVTRLNAEMRDAIKQAKPELLRLLSISSPLRERLSHAVRQACAARGESAEVGQAILMESLALSEADQRDIAAHFEWEAVQWGAQS
jgi:hypothetical protein